MEHPLAAGRRRNKFGECERFDFDDDVLAYNVTLWELHYPKKINAFFDFIEYLSTFAFLGNNGCMYLYSNRITHLLSIHIITAENIASAEGFVGNTSFLLCSLAANLSSKMKPDYQLHILLILEILKSLSLYSEA